MTSPAFDYPTLRTERLVLRPFQAADSRAVSELAGERAIADTTISIPHPYSTEQAEEWIARHPTEWRRG